MLRQVSALLLLCCCSCLGTAGQNPSFDLKPDDAETALAQMSRTPRPLARPLVVVGGYLDFFVAATALHDQFRELTGDDRIIGVSLGTCGDFDECRRRIIDAVQKAFPTADPHQTAEVDVIGVSMGGLAAAYAATPSSRAAHQRRLRIARLFAISVPFRGARMASLPTCSALQRQMRVHSRFLRALDVAGADYPIYCYVRLGDITVGSENAAPAQRTAWWVSNPPLQLAHGWALFDERIQADIARRLRGEAPYATEPPAPLPTR